MKLKSTLFISFLNLASLTGCAIINVRGHEVDPAQLEQINVGTTKKEDVAKILGTPSSVGTFGNKTWIYMSDVTSTRAFFNPVILKSNVTRIEFDCNDVVASIDSLTEKDKQVISHIQRTTPTSGHQFGVIEQIFGNFGRFNGRDPDK